MTKCVVCPGANPNDTKDGLVCFTCSNRILKHLRELEDYLPTLSLHKHVGDPGRRSPGFGSQSPANDTTIHHTDWRSNWDALDGLGAVATIHSWARSVREDREYHPPTYITLASELSALRANHHWICCQPFVDEYARELHEVHMAVRAAASDPVPRSVGRCMTVHVTGECGGKVFEKPEYGGVQCSKCNRLYTGLDLDRLRAAQEAS